MNKLSEHHIFLTQQTTAALDHSEDPANVLQTPPLINNRLAALESFAASWILKLELQAQEITYRLDQGCEDMITALPRFKTDVRY